MSEQLGLKLVSCSVDVLCAYGQPTCSDGFAPDWDGPHHCAQCAADVERACQQFEADVQAGKYDSEGYTVNERKAQAKRRERERR